MKYHQRSWISLLQRFYAELMKSDGTNYEPESLRVMIACLDGHLREHGATHSILKDKCFETSRDIGRKGD